VLECQYGNHHGSGRGGGSTKYHPSRARAAAWRDLIRLHFLEHVWAYC
jgi:hypothetical protein